MLVSCLFLFSFNCHNCIHIPFMLFSTLYIIFTFNFGRIVRHSLLYRGLVLHSQSSIFVFITKVCCFYVICSSKTILLVPASSDKFVAFNIICYQRSNIVNCCNYKILTSPLCNLYLVLLLLLMTIQLVFLQLGIISPNIPLVDYIRLRLRLLSAIYTL